MEIRLDDYPVNEAQANPRNILEKAADLSDYHAMRQRSLWALYFVQIMMMSRGALSVQTSIPQISSASVMTSADPAPSYPESPSGLEHLAKDIVEAQSRNDGPRSDLLLKSLVLPNAYDWYEQVFDHEAAIRAGEYYQKEASAIPRTLGEIFQKANQQKRSQIRAVRYEQSCDDSASEDAYGVLIRRRQPIPIYELRFFSDGRLTRLFPLAYVDGAFRFFLFPDFRPKIPTAETEPDIHAVFVAQETAPPIPRVTVEGNMQPLKLLHKVEPTYPEKTRRENAPHGEATQAVKVHIVVDKNGQVQKILSTHGVCSLAKSAVSAVRQWRYQPYLVNGTPVEVDTDVVIVFYLYRQP